MSNFMKILLVLWIIIWFGALIIPLSVHAAGTDSGTVITNADDAEDTQADSPGELSLSYTNKTGADTKYVDTGTTAADRCTCTVQLAWDISFLDTGGAGGTANHDTDGVGYGQPGDTIVYTVGFYNRGNGPISVNTDSVVQG
ncbi:MAG: hypothetical protein AB1765_11555, partial [Candidatus Hydrogenedentota bacterium]